MSTTLLSRPLHIAIELTERGHHPALRGGVERLPVRPDRWIELTAGAPGVEPLDLTAFPDSVRRVRAADLRAAQRLRAGFRAEAEQAGRDPDAVSVVLDIETLLAADASTALRRLGELDSRLSTPRAADSVPYIGTPEGLVGLIADLRLAGVADGVTLRPLEVDTTLGLIVGDVMTELAARGLSHPADGLAELLTRSGFGSVNG
jgi:alkanesulfonate monooxygenase SsuD/methylene tetrahydromethanopterin reductase-like flavin-dependent oxidoreductase (luciferase family)